MKLFKVTVWNDYEHKTSTSDILVLSKNKKKARESVEENFWTLSGMEVNTVEEIDMSVSQVLGIVMPEE